MQNKKALEILLGALSDEEWQQLKLLKEAKSAYSTSTMVEYRKIGSIHFANWILKHTIIPGYDTDGNSCWVIADGSGRTFPSEELYEEYLRGSFDKSIFEEDE